MGLLGREGVILKETTPIGSVKNVKISLKKV
jgi:hypothetical protein